MASFPSAVSAATAALQIQREMTGGEVRVCVGLNAGEPIAEDDDLFRPRYNSQRAFVPPSSSTDFVPRTSLVC